MTDHRHIQELISADYDGQATAEEKKLIEEHLRGCEACRAYEGQLKKLSATLEQWDNEDLSPDLEAKIQRRLKEVVMSREKVAVRKHPLFRVGVGGGGAIIVVVILLLSTQMHIHRGMQGRLKFATDDIGTQFSAGNTNLVYQAIGRERRGADAGKILAEQTADLSDQRQYEPYYLTTDYSMRPSGNVPNVRTLVSKEQAPMPVAKSEGVRTRASGGYQESSYDPSDSGLITMDKGYPQERKFKESYQTRDEDVIYRDDYEYPQRRYPYRPSNTEEYARIYEAPFLDAQQNPLSTFSVDVDTTSYSNIRRFLNQGQIPPEDAVRIEEMINYFSYDYPNPGWGRPFSVTTQASYCPWNPQHYLVQVGIKGKTLSAKKVPPSNLVFLIDVSGSMNQPNKLPLLKDAFRMFISQLSDNERVAIVVYSGSASVVLDSTSGSQKWVIQQAIDNLRAGGSTAGAAGIQTAYDIAQRNFIRKGNNRVILATDGDFNVGVSSNSELVRLIESKRDNGIYLSILGFGTGNYKDAKMEQIADKGNGNYFYIDSLKEGRKVLVDELGSTLFTIAKDVKLQVEFNPAQVQSYKLVGYENRALANRDFNDDTKDAGEIGAGHTVTAFYEIVPTAAVGYNAPGVDPLKYQRSVSGLFTNTDLMTIKLRYKDPEGSSSKLIKTIVRQRDITAKPNEDFLFGSAVAEFGLLLKNSPYKSAASYDNVLMRARLYQGSDKHGHKAEFISLVEKAKRLDHRSPYQAPIPMPYPAYDGPEESSINFKGK